MFCPKCGCEYRDGFFKCSDCGTVLVPRLSIHSTEAKQSEHNDVAFVVVLRTGRVWEVEMIAEALKKADIPCYQQLETSTGLSLAKEIPQAMGPGEWWAFYVPKTFQKRAEEVLSALPIEVTTNIDLWHFTPSGEGKTFFRTYAIHTLIAIGISLILLIIGLLRR